MDAIRCSNCQKTQARMKFSATQLKNRGGRRAGPGGGPMCRACTGEPPTEFQCYGCDQVLDRDKFAKTQLRKKDNRLCVDCSQERQDREANVAAAVQEEQILEELREKAGQDESAWGTSGLRSTLPSASNSGYPSASGSRADDGVWIQDDSSLSYGKTIRQDDGDSEETSTQMGMSSTGTARTNGTWENVQPIERTYPRAHASAPSHSTNPGFHKQGAVKKDDKTRAEERFAREHRREKEDSDQSEPEDDDDGEEWEL